MAKTSFYYDMPAYAHILLDRRIRLKMYNSWTISKVEEVTGVSFLIHDDILLQVLDLIVEKDYV